ncbi:MAG: SIS domain-containing protein [Desulfobacterales bacterium]|nr:SIS domain-containing protein [Desulfobacterales bacterium]
MKKHILSSLTEASGALEQLMDNNKTITAIGKAAKALITCFENNGQVFSCGNGGSMCDAMHFAEELSGKFRKERKGLPATAISDPGHISCVSNDYGYEVIFSRYMESHGKPGDCLLAISTSGSSMNIMKAVEAAKKKEMTVISLTGRIQSAIGVFADVDICTPGGHYADRVQELHIKVIHILIELIERKLFPKNYK